MLHSRGIPFQHKGGTVRMEDHYEALYLLSNLPHDVSERGVRKLFQKKHNLQMVDYRILPDQQSAVVSFETNRG